MKQYLAVIVTCVQHGQTAKIFPGGLSRPIIMAESEDVVVLPGRTRVFLESIDVRRGRYAPCKLSSRLSLDD